MMIIALLTGCVNKGGGSGDKRSQQTKIFDEPEDSPEPDGPEDAGDSTNRKKADKDKKDPGSSGIKKKPTQPPVQESDRNEADWAVAYLNVIDKLIEKYGEGIMKENAFYGDSCMSGVGVVRLIDFDGNGTYELYCAYSNGESPLLNKQVIYGYDNGLITLMEERDVSNPGTDVSPSVTFLSKFGKVFLVQVNQIVDGKYYALENGRLQVVFEYYYDFWEEGINSVNGTPVTEDEVMYAISEMEAGGDLEHIDFYGDDEGSEITKTWETIVKIWELAQ